MQLKQGRLHFSATDLSNFISCHRVTELDVLLAKGELDKPDYSDPYTDVIQKLGLEHEEAYIRHLRSKGKEVDDLRDAEGDTHLERTVNAMKAGSEIIIQAAFDNGNWRGKADILYRVDIPVGEKSSALGQWYYDIGDTKLAQETKGGTMLQLCVYADLISEVQGMAPRKLYVVKPGVGFAEEEYEYSNYAAYYRFMRDRFETSIQTEGDTYPLPVAHCSICKWWQVCDKRRRADDHLSFVAGMQNSHVKELEGNGTSTMENFAKREKALDERPSRGNKDTYVKLHRQAQIQFQGKTENRHIAELIESDQEKFGLRRLPKPSAGDLFFDIESDRFYKDGGLEYLFGIAFHENGKRVYKAWWALNRKEEKQAFSELMEFFIKRWKEFPNFNIYHFAPYEPAALKRLMLRHAVYAEELDKLLRAERFIDLHSITKESILASVETYGLKDLEPVIGFTRDTPLEDARYALRFLQKALELYGLDSLENNPEVKTVVQSYNAEDCYATEALRDWLEDRRKEYELKFDILSRPELKDGEVNEDRKEKLERFKLLFETLTQGLEGIVDDPDAFDDQQKAKWLLAHLLEYFHREEKNFWWEYFARLEMEHEDLLEDRKAISGLTFVKEYKRKGDRTPVHVYSFPLQEISFKEGAQIRHIDKLAVEEKKEKIGSVVEVDTTNNLIHIKKRGDAAEIHPVAIQEFSKIPAALLERSLLAFAEDVVANGLDQEGAVFDLLMGAPPKIDGHSGNIRDVGQTLLEAAIGSASRLKGSVLPIQGPPGTGKTYTGAHIILELVRQGKKVGVTAVSHKAIENLLKRIQIEAAKANVPVKVMHKDKVDDDMKTPGIDYAENGEEALAALDTHVVGATAWLWAHEDAASALDYLFIDEAGQMSLAYVLAIARAAHNLVMLGDPQQLEQPQQAAHPEGADVSALSHYLGEHQVIPADKGLFLNTTWRLHPDICDFTSELYYEGKLGWKEGLQEQVLHGTKPFDGAGLLYVPVDHEGNRNKSDEEVSVIKKLARDLLTGHTNNGKKPGWHHLLEGDKPLTTDDIMIIAPYNAQVAALQEAMPDMRVGTVDKFQGQEAAVVIYSMASSSTEESPRGMSFLFEPNRLNVATSRARCAFVMVASPRLFEAECHSPKQMVWANGMCRYREMSRLVG